MNIFLGGGHSTEQKIPEGGGGGSGEETPNVEVIGMLIGIFFWENHKKYPNFDFKLLKYPDYWRNTINTVFPIRLQKDMLNKKPGKKSFS